ncbi:Sucrase/ferredoxin-like domain-containing protein [Trichoderma austrokoningii]
MPPPSATTTASRMPVKQKMAVSLKSLMNSVLGAVPASVAGQLAAPSSSGGSAPMEALFGKTSAEADGEECLHDCESCSVKYPRGFKIDEEDVLYGQVKGWSTHVLVGTGKSDWVRDVADEKGSVMEAIQKVGGVTNGRLMLSASNIPTPHDTHDYSEPTTVILLPAFATVQNVHPRNVSQLIASVINNAPTSSSPLVPWRSVIPASLPSPDASLANLTVASCPHSAVILLCSQKTRDARCGQSAPLLRKELERHLRPLGLYRDLHDERPGGVGIYFISHVGGHKYSANVMVYRRPNPFGKDDEPLPEGVVEAAADEKDEREAENEEQDVGAAQCIWLARIRPEDCENLIKAQQNMRLLSTETYQITEFFDYSIPEYAILSHTWGPEELTYQDLTTRSIDVARQTKPQGFAKVEGACALARSEGHAYIWIDTCCIDKTSSAELSEAINSMYSWYRGAAVCYAYLIDVEEHCFSDEFRGSRWFTRGWTLQELIAPRDVVFYSRDWRLLGRKSLLKGLLSDITGIDISVLAGADPSIITVARKMSWAASRTTTRVEDAAYCLMGLFSVSIPLIYGEGSKAFFRLQEEIIKTVDDQSIFAWVVPELEHPNRHLFGLLAESPSAFKHTGKLVFPFAASRPSRRAAQIVNRSLQVELLVQPQDLLLMQNDNPAYRLQANYYLAALGCRFGPSGDFSPCIDICALDEGNSQFARVNPWILRETHMDSTMSLRSRQHSGSWLNHVTAYFEQLFRDPTVWDSRLVSVSQIPREFTSLGFRIQLLSSDLSTREGFPADRWYRDNRVLQGSYEVHEKYPCSVLRYERRHDEAKNEGITRSIEGVVRIGISDVGRERKALVGTRDFARQQMTAMKHPVQWVALVLGMDVVYNFDMVGWRQEPWCAMVRLEADEHLADFGYQIDWGENRSTTFDCSSIGALLMAEIVMLPEDNLYTVQLECRHVSDSSASWWTWVFGDVPEYDGSDDRVWRVR